MELNLSGRNAIVTGGSAGIGLACARALAAEGVSVALAARDAGRLARAVAEVEAAARGGARALPIAADLGLAADVERIVKTASQRLGPVDILINNAGSAIAGRFLELADQAFLDAWNLKLLGYIRMVRAVVPSMAARRDGRIVNIIGGAARSPSPAFLPGGTANAALLNFTRGIAAELARQGIRINAISPGSTATERADRLAAQTAAARRVGLDEVLAERAREMPIGRLVAPEEIAAMAVFLVSDLAGAIAGAEVVIDGGRSAGAADR